MKKTTLVMLTACLFLAGTATVSLGTGMPDVRILDTLQDAYSPVAFNHQKHTEIAGNCAACHHEHVIGGEFPCKQCHALTPQMFKKSAVHSFMACKDCHGSFDPDNSAMPGLKTAYHRTCFACHRGMGNIGTDPKGCTEICHTTRTE